MANKKESDFQKELMDEIRENLPGCFIMKNDANYIQGVPDWTILYKGRWALLECKKSISSPYRPNQEYYIKLLDDMSFSAMICPENKEEVLNGLYQALRA